MKVIFQNKQWIYFAVIVLALILLSIFGQRRTLEEYPPFVSYSPSPTGTKALYTYLMEEGIETKQWKHPPDLLQTEKKALLIMIEPAVKLSKKDLQSYEKFIKTGNTLLLFSENPEALFNIEMDFVIESIDEQQKFSYNHQEYRLQLNPLQEIVGAEQGERFLTLDSKTYGIKRNYGEGQLIVIKASNLLMNSKITKEEHAEFITDLLKDVYREGETILFDEYVHGRSQVKAYIKAYPAWFIVLMLQMILVTVFWLFYKGKRFGPIYTPRGEIVRFGDEAITSLASWHLQAKRYQDSLKIQADYTKQLLQEVWEIPYHFSWTESESLLKEKWKVPEKNINNFVRGLERVLKNKKIQREEYVKWSKRLDDLRKEVDKS